MTNETGNGDGNRRVNQAEQNAQSRLRSLHRPARRRPEEAPPSYDQATLPPYPDERTYRTRMGDQDMHPVEMAPEQAVNHLEIGGFQVRLSAAERQAIRYAVDRNIPTDEPPGYQLDDPNDGAVFTVRPVEEYGDHGTYSRLDYRSNMLRPAGDAELGLAIHPRGDPVILSEEDRARLSETAVPLEQRQTARELDWLNDNMVQRYTSALERLEQIYADQPQLRVERSQALWDRLEAFRAGFQRSLSTGEGNDAGNAPESSRAARQRPQPAMHHELPLSEDARRNVITDLDEMLAEQFPEAYDPARAKQRRAAEIPGAEAGQMEIEFDDGSRQGTPVMAASSREEIEQFAQSRDDFAPFSPGFMLSPTPPPGLALPDEQERRSPSEGLPSSGGGLGSPSAALDLGFSQGPGPAESRPARRAPSAERFSPEPAALTAAQHAFLANWPHDRQPTFDEMSEAMHDSGNALRGGASSDVGFSNQRESSPVRPRKRTRVDLSDEGSSGRESAGEGPSDRPPARRRRLMPQGQREPSLSQGPDIREDGPSGDRIAREPNRRDRERTGTEPAIDVTGNSGNREPGLDRQFRNPQEPQRTFDDHARAQARDRSR